MPLKLTVDSLDAVEEPFRALYAEKDGKFHLGVEGIEDTGGLKTALQKERADRAAFEKQVKSWQGLGKTPEEIRELLEAQAKAEEDKATKAGEWDKLRAQMNEKHAAELKSKDEATGKMRTSLERYLVDAAATQAIAAEKGVPALLLPHVQRHVKVIEQDGDYVAQVVDAKGDPRVNGKGEPLTIADLVSEMKQSEIYGRAFEASGNTGGGTRPANGGAGIAQVKRKADLKDRAARAAFVDKHGHEAYFALPD
jgi:hypothetical protein